MKKYQHLIFDLDNTLLDFSASEEKALRKVLTGFELADTVETMNHYRVINEGLWRQLEKGQIERERLFATRFGLFLKEYGIQADGEEVEHRFRGYLEEGTDIVENAAELLLALKEEGYSIYAGTNGCGSTQRKRLTNTRLLPYFEELFISEELGYEKPSTQFFDPIFDFVKGAPKEEFLMIGDSLTSDIQGAINTGIDSVWFNYHNQPTTDLKSTYAVEKLTDLADIIGLEKPIAQSSKTKETLLTL